MTEWTQSLPQTPGYYWYCDDHWTDGERMMVKLYRSFSGWRIIKHGHDQHFEAPARAYWLGPIEPPPRPVFGKGEPG